MKLRILIIDDDKDICELLKKALTGKGHEVHTYLDPTQTPFFDNEDCPCKPDDTCADALLADIVMPNVEGVDFIKKLKEFDCWPLSIGNVAVMSGYLTLHYMEDLQEMGVNYFRKPFKLDDIYAWADDCAERLRQATQA